MNNIYKLIPKNKSGNKIFIKKENRGKFTDYCEGKVTQECINRAKKSGNKKLIKRAVFAENARHFKHSDGGNIHSTRMNRSILDSTGKIGKNLKLKKYEDK